MNQKIIVIDGKTYHSVDEMPEDVRRNYESALRNFDKNQNGTPNLFENKKPFADQNKNGVPDAFEGLASFQGPTTNVTSAAKIIVNGQVYDNLSNCHRMCAQNTNRPWEPWMQTKMGSLILWKACS